MDEIQKELKFVRSPINLKKKKKIKKTNASLYKKIDTNHTKKLKVGENRRSIAIKEAVHIEAQSSSVINVDRSNRGMTNNFTLPRICSDFIGYRCVDDCLHDIIIFITFHAATRTKDIIKTINLRAIFIKCIPKCSPPISSYLRIFARVIRVHYTHVYVHRGTFRKVFGHFYSHVCCIPLKLFQTNHFDTTKVYLI